MTWTIVFEPIEKLMILFADFVKPFMILIYKYNLLVVFLLICFAIYIDNSNRNVYK